MRRRLKIFKKKLKFSQDEIYSTVTNEIRVERKQINVVDNEGCKVQYIKAPGDYYIQFSQIVVERPLPNLSGDIGATLQVSFNKLRYFKTC